MDENIKHYNDSLPSERQEICDRLSVIIDRNLAYTESKIWHGHPVWFIEGNPIVGYSSQKGGIKLLFWSGADFNEVKLEPGSGKFKDASITYDDAKEIKEEDVTRWLTLSEQIQWDYKNIVKRRGELKRLK